MNTQVSLGGAIAPGRESSVDDGSGARLRVFGALVTVDAISP